MVSHLIPKSVFFHKVKSNEFSLHGPAIACLSHLCKSCTSQFLKNIPFFLELILTNLNNDSKNPSLDGIKTECVNALSSIFENCSEEAKSYVVPTLKILFAIGNNDVDLNENEFGMTDDFNDDMFMFQNSIVLNSTAVRVICKIFSIYPDMIGPYFSDVLSLLMKYKNHLSGDGTYACAKGVVSISKALVHISNSEQFVSVLVNELIVPLMTGSDSETSGTAFLALSIIIKKYPVVITGKVFEIISMALNGDLFFQRGKVSYNRILFNGILKLLKSLIKSDFIDQLNPFLPKLQEFLNSSSNEIQDFALEFFGYYCSDYSQIIDDNLKLNIIQISLNKSLGYAYIDCLTKYAEIIPQFVEPFVSKIIDQMNQSLSNNSPEIVIEKYILLFNMLLQKIHFDISPFISLILQNTPPLVLLKKTTTFLELLQFIYSNFNGEFNNQIAISIIKLFSESDSVLKSRHLNPTILNSMKSILFSISSTMPDFNVFCSQACNNDPFKLSNLNNHLHNNI